MKNYKVENSGGMMEDVKHFIEVAKPKVKSFWGTCDKLTKGVLIALGALTVFLVVMGTYEAPTFEEKVADALDISYTHDMELVDDGFFEESLGYYSDRYTGEYWEEFAEYSWEEYEVVLEDGDIITLTIGLTEIKEDYTGAGNIKTIESDSYLIIEGNNRDTVYEVYETLYNEDLVDVNLHYSDITESTYDGTFSIYIN